MAVDWGKNLFFKVLDTWQVCCEEDIHEVRLSDVPNYQVPLLDQHLLQKLMASPWQSPHIQGWIVTPYIFLDCSSFPQFFLLAALQFQDTMFDLLKTCGKESDLAGRLNRLAWRISSNRPCLLKLATWCYDPKNPMFYLYLFSREDSTCQGSLVQKDRNEGLL